MEYSRKTVTRDGRTLLIRNAVGADAEAYIRYYIRAHSETEYLTTYPDEKRMDAGDVAARLENTAGDPRSLELCAFADGELVGSAGIGMIRDRDKTRHRAELGISIIKPYWGLGIGRELVSACIEMARQAGYLQLELEVVSDNARAVALYEKLGFTEYGRNPKAFRTRQGQWQELVLMRLEL